MTEARRGSEVVVFAYVAAECVGPGLHALEYQPEVQVLDRVPDPALKRERWTIKGNFPRRWHGVEVRPVFTIIGSSQPIRVEWRPVLPGDPPVPYSTHRLRLSDVEHPTPPTALDRYHAEALYRWGWHLARLAIMLPVTAATTAVAWAGYVAAQARGDVFIAIMPSAFGLAGVAALVLYAARRPR